VGKADISPRLKDMGSETEHSAPFSAELMRGVMPPFPHYLHDMGRDNCTITSLEERGWMDSNGVWQMKTGIKHTSNNILICTVI
jgi:SH3-like domain-containing protein